jgi:hypothetical protein
MKNVMGAQWKKGHNDFLENANSKIKMNQLSWKLQNSSSAGRLVERTKLSKYEQKEMKSTKFT